MSKYCSKCGTKAFDDSLFCEKCGADLDQYTSPTTPETNNNHTDFEQQVADTYQQSQPQQVPNPQYYPQTQNYNTYQKPSKAKPIIAIVATVAIVTMLIAVYFLVPFGGNEEENVSIATEGPKVSLQSLANGNSMVIPKVGYTGVYGYYVDGTKIGEISYSSEGNQIYDGEECIKVTGAGDYTFDAVGQEIAITYTYDGYVANDDYNLKYLHFIISYSGADVEMTMTYDEETGEITTEYSYPGYVEQSMVMKMPDNYWEMTNIENILTVGYETEYTYSIDYSGIESETTIQLEVVEKNDVIVPAGKFKDCYKIEMGQDSITTSIVWINEDGVVPTMEVPSESAGTSGDLVMQLESYKQS